MRSIAEKRAFAKLALEFIQLGRARGAVFVPTANKVPTMSFRQFNRKKTKDPETGAFEKGSSPTKRDLSEFDSRYTGQALLLCDTPRNYQIAVIDLDDMRHQAYCDARYGTPGVRTTSPSGGRHGYYRVPLTLRLESTHKLLGDPALLSFNHTIEVVRGGVTTVYAWAAEDPRYVAANGNVYAPVHGSDDVVTPRFPRAGNVAFGCTGVDLKSAGGGVIAPWSNRPADVKDGVARPEAFYLPEDAVTPEEFWARIDRAPLLNEALVRDNIETIKRLRREGKARVYASLGGVGARGMTRVEQDTLITEAYETSMRVEDPLEQIEHFLLHDPMFRWAIDHPEDLAGREFCNKAIAQNIAAAGLGARALPFWHQIADRQQGFTRTAQDRLYEGCAKSIAGGSTPIGYAEFEEHSAIPVIPTRASGPMELLKTLSGLRKKSYVFPEDRTGGFYGSIASDKLTVEDHIGASTVVNERYLSALPQTPEGWITAVASETGTGKSTMLRALLGAPSTRVLVITDRTVQIQRAKTVLGLTPHDELDREAPDPFKVLRCAVTINSLPGFLARIGAYTPIYDYVVIDDCVSVFQNIHGSHITSTVGSVRVVEAMQQVMSRAKRVLVLDAFLNDVALEIAQHLCASDSTDTRPVHLLHNTYKHAAGRTATFAAHKDAVLCLFNERVAGGGCAMLQCAQITDANEAARRLEGVVLLCTSETKSDPRVVEFALDPNQFLATHPEIRAVVSTSTLESNISIDDARFDQMFVVAQADQWVTWRAVHQMAARCRAAKTIHLFVGLGTYDSNKPLSFSSENYQGDATGSRFLSQSNHLTTLLFKLAMSNAGLAQLSLRHDAALKFEKRGFSVLKGAGWDGRLATRPAPSTTTATPPKRNGAQTARIVGAHRLLTDLGGVLTAAQLRDAGAVMQNGRHADPHDYQKLQFLHYFYTALGITARQLEGHDVFEASADTAGLLHATLTDSKLNRVGKTHFNFDRKSLLNPATRMKFIGKMLRSAGLAFNPKQETTGARARVYTTAKES